MLGYPCSGTLDNGVNFTGGAVSSAAGMDNDSTRFQLTAPVQPGSSGGPVLDGAGSLVGVVVARMSDVASMEKTSTVPQNVNFGIKGEVAASFLRANGARPALSGGLPPVPATQVASSGSASTVQVVCSRPSDRAPHGPSRGRRRPRRRRLSRRPRPRAAGSPWRGGGR